MHLAPQILPLVAALLATPSLVSAAAAPQRRAGAAPSPWVTVKPNGEASTVMPVVTVTNGATTTLLAPPESLTQTSVYTLTEGGRATTITGLAPVASATGTQAAGSFLACSNYQGLDAPFCQPRRGSQLAPGHTYYITWDPAFFASPNASLKVQAKYDDGEGFTSATMPAAQGFFPWAIDAAFLTTQKVTTMNVTLFLAYPDGPANATTETLGRGPSVLVANPSSPTGSRGPSALAIAVPVVIGLAVLGLMAFCFWSWRRHGKVPILSALRAKRRPGQGYGVRQSHAQRTGGAAGGRAKGAGIQLTSRESWSPTQGQNVFREEIQRQDRGH